MLQKLNFFSIFTALVLFCFPWVDIQCSEKTQATQSGLQVVYGGATSFRDAGETKPKNPENPEKPDNEAQETLGFAPLTATALALLIAAGYISWRELRSGKHHPDLLATALPAIALGLLLLQLKVGFPAEKRLPELLASKPASRSPEKPVENFFQALVAQGSVVVAGNIEVKTLPSFYYLLATLGVPSLILANSLLNKAKSQQ